MLTNRKAPPPSQCHPIHRPLAMHPRLSSPMVWALPTTQGLRAQEVDPITQQHPLTRLLGQQMHQNKKHWCRKGSHTCGAPFNACLITCFKRVLPFLGPSKDTFWRNLPNSSGVRCAEASNNVRCSNLELCYSTFVPGGRVHAHISHRCPSVAMAVDFRWRRRSKPSRILCVQDKATITTGPSTSTHSRSTDAQNTVSEAHDSAFRAN